MVAAEYVRVRANVCNLEKLEKPGEGIASESTFHFDASTSEVDASHFRLDLCHCNSISQLQAIDANNEQFQMCQTTHQTTRQVH
jgi:hypothetical protein